MLVLCACLGRTLRLAGAAAQSQLGCVGQFDRLRHCQTYQERFHGAGLGNAFLSRIRAANAILKMARCFDNTEIVHVEGDVDPVHDLGIISKIKRIKGIKFVDKLREKFVKNAWRGGQSLVMKMKGLATPPGRAMMNSMLSTPGQSIRPLRPARASLMKILRFLRHK